jgi:hypothetical protein
VGCYRRGTCTQPRPAIHGGRKIKAKGRFGRRGQIREPARIGPLLLMRIYQLLATRCVALFWGCTGNSLGWQAFARYKLRGHRVPAAGAPCPLGGRALNDPYIVIAYDIVSKAEANPHAEGVLSSLFWQDVDDADGNKSGRRGFFRSARRGRLSSSGVAFPPQSRSQWSRNRLSDAPRALDRFER